MLVWRLDLAWKSGHPNQCLRLGDNAKTDRTFGARFRESASYSRYHPSGSISLMIARIFIAANRDNSVRYGQTRDL